MNKIAKIAAYKITHLSHVFLAPSHVDTPSARAKKSTPAMSARHGTMRSSTAGVSPSITSAFLSVCGESEKQSGIFANKSIACP